MKNITKAEIYKVQGTERVVQEDCLATEEPLEIRLGFEKEGIRHQKSISVTMRTPGDDEALALGFLFTEGIITGISQVRRCYSPPVRRTTARGNVIVVELVDGMAMNFRKLERHFYTTSSCGVCGKSSVEAVRVQGCFDLYESVFEIDASVLYGLPQTLLSNQEAFDLTGGLHGAALFDSRGSLGPTSEDVGRHNAVDKIVGRALKDGRVPLTDRGVLVSGRAGFELVQKSVVAGAPLLAAVGAPSSLAVSLAEESGMTLVGFLRNGQFNIYSHPERIRF